MQYKRQLEGMRGLATNGSIVKQRNSKDKLSVAIDFKELSSEELKSKLENLLHISYELLGIMQSGEAFDKSTEQIIAGLPLLSFAIASIRKGEHEGMRTIQLILRNCLTGIPTATGASAIVRENIDIMLEKGEAFLPAITKALQKIDAQEDRKVLVERSLTFLEAKNPAEAWTPEDIQLFISIMDYGDEDKIERCKKIIMQWRSHEDIGEQNIRKFISAFPPNDPEYKKFAITIDALGFGLLEGNEVTIKDNSDSISERTRTEFMKACIMDLFQIPQLADVMQISHQRLLASWFLSSYNHRKGSTWYFIERNIRTAQILLQYNKDCLSVLVKKFRLTNFARYPLGMLKKQYERYISKEESPVQPQILVLMPAIEANGESFEWGFLEEFYKQKKDEFQFQTFEYRDKIDIFKTAKALKSRKAPLVNLVIFTAHGGPLKKGEQTMMLRYSKERDKIAEVYLQDILYDDRIARLKRVLAPDCVIILNSCYLGVDEGMAQKLSKVLERVVISGAGPGALAKIESAPENPAGYNVYFDEINRRGTYSERVKGVAYRNGVKIQGAA